MPSTKSILSSLTLPGKRIKKIRKTAQGHSLQHSLDLSDVPNGLYAIKLTVKEQVSYEEVCQNEVVGCFT